MVLEKKTKISKSESFPPIVWNSVGLGTRLLFAIGCSVRHRKFAFVHVKVCNTRHWHANTLYFHSPLTCRSGLWRRWQGQVFSESEWKYNVLACQCRVLHTLTCAGIFRWSLLGNCWLRLWPQRETRLSLVESLLPEFRVPLRGVPEFANKVGVLPFTLRLLCL